MQEAVFSDTVPISYSDVLNGNGINGISFENWDELRSDGDFLYTESDDIISLTELRGESARLRKEVYSKDAYKQKLISALKPSC